MYGIWIYRTKVAQVLIKQSVYVAPFDNVSTHELIKALKAA